MSSLMAAEKLTPCSQLSTGLDTEVIDELMEKGFVLGHAKAAV